MRKIKEVSLALLVTPILFTGCMQEKVSTIIPRKSTDNKIALDLKQTTHAKVVDNDIHFINKETTPQENSELLLTLLAYEDTHQDDNKSYKLSQLTTPSLSIDSDWEENSKEDEIIETAEQFLGVKYIWAANGPSAFDCSGFTKYVFKQNGISLPRHSSRQANIGEKIGFEEMQKGDLVFFDTHKKFTKTVNHVGIYIGHHQFIHASSGGKKVMITSFDEKKFYKNKFLYARRVLNGEESFAMNIKQKSIVVN